MTHVLHRPLTNGCNPVSIAPRHVFGRPVEWCWIMLNEGRLNVSERHLIAIKLSIQNHSTFLFNLFSGVNNNYNEFVRQHVQQCRAHVYPGNTNLRNSTTFNMIQQGGHTRSTSLIRQLWAMLNRDVESFGQFFQHCATKKYSTVLDDVWYVARGLTDLNKRR